jgi:ketosteroid isomerase-like protein
MPARKPPPVNWPTPSDTEAAFYEALRTADADALLACFADEDEIVCIHPGGPRLVGAAAIRASFEAMFQNGSVQAKPQNLRAVESGGTAVHSVLEHIQVLTQDGPREAYVIATNVYLRTPLGWRMLAHHASPGTPHEMQEVSSAPKVLH